MPKVIDAIMFSGELDMLELRLNELNDVVDHFVIVEAAQPHGAAGRREPSYRADSKRWSEVIGPFKDKVHYEIVELSPEYTDRESGWRRENCHQDALMAPALQLSTSPQDVLMVSAVDEIPRASAIEAAIPEVIKRGAVFYLVQDMFYCNVNSCSIPWVMSHMGTIESYQKAGGTLAPRGHLDQTKPSGSYAVVEGAGWHFSSFFDLPRLREKLRNFAHSSDRNVQAILKLTDMQLAQAILTPRNIFTGELLEKRPSTDPRLPKYLLDHPEKFAHFHAAHLEAKYGPVVLQDMVIAVIRGMKWPALRPYAVSLDRSGFRGTRVMFVENVDREVRENLKRLGFVVVDRLPMVPTDEERRLMPEHWIYGVHRIDPVVTFLKYNPARYVIWADVRDVVFQTNPVLWLERNIQNHKLVAAGLGRTLKSCPYNGVWAAVASGAAIATGLDGAGTYKVEGTADDELWKDIQGQEGAAFATIAGEYETVLNLLEDLQGGCAAVPGTTDQGMFNCLIRTSPYKEVTWIPPLSASFSAQWWDGRPEAEIDLPDYGAPIFDTKDHVVYAPDGVTPFSIVHMYDRNEEWTKAIQEIYS